MKLKSESQSYKRIFFKITIKKNSKSKYKINLYISLNGEIEPKKSI
jgi:hypothetical protein